jgi:hypothetical protein
MGAWGPGAGGGLRGDVDRDGIHGITGDLLSFAKMPVHENQAVRLTYYWRG